MRKTSHRSHTKTKAAQALVDAATRQMKALPFYNAFFQTATKPAIALDQIRTAMTAGAADRYDGLIAAGLVPMGRWGRPEDVAQAASALASGRLAFATGSVLHVDGALSIARL